MKDIAVRILKIKEGDSKKRSCQIKQLDTQEDKWVNVWLNGNEWSLTEGDEVIMTINTYTYKSKDGKQGVGLSTGLDKITPLTQEEAELPEVQPPIEKVTTFSPNAQKQDMIIRQHSQDMALKFIDLCMMYLPECELKALSPDQLFQKGQMYTDMFTDDVYRLDVTMDKLLAEGDVEDKPEDIGDVMNDEVPF